MPDSREIYLARSISDFRICGIASCRVSLTLVRSRMGRLLLILRLVSVCGDDAHYFSSRLSRSILCGVRVECLARPCCRHVPLQCHLEAALSHDAWRDVFV